MTSVYFILAGDITKASSRVRGYWIAEALEELGFSCSLTHDNSRKGLLSLFWKVHRFDVIIFQKTYSRYHRWLMIYAKLLGVRTYLDFDDAPSRINSATTLRNIESMMRMSNGVFVGSLRLLEYAKKFQSNAHLVPSAINVQKYSVVTRKSLDSSVCLGWIGNGAHYKDDLIQILITPLSALAEKFKVRLLIIGSCYVEQLHREFSSIKNLDVKMLDQIEWANPEIVSTLLSEIDIGLYPLLDNKFNDFKCGFKALEYMALGIPVIASPNAINKHIVENGVNGYIADSGEEWRDAMEQLVIDKKLREQFGVSGKFLIESEFNTAVVAQRVSVLLG